ncbi:metalloprotease TIKI1-like [Oncorhynchus tshawytscha]|uniref:Metalloprotease TIKI n=1 Tax=Oncorhynchus tshawytscha TaxID=74940 RepID=A0AAZ3SQ73_ONCTS|nr:metalloprotease TIKI1-like [Oncorhynchus tshawytscha]
MLVSWVAFIQAFLTLLVKGADQWSLRESSNCELNKKQSDLNSFLWTIKRNPPSYFYGTIHVPYTRVWDFIPENSKKAFQESNMVYLELDLTDPYTISALTSCQLLPQGGTLQDVLPRDIYGRLKRHLEYVKLMMPFWMTPDQRGKGLYADYLFNAIAGNWERKRPVWVMLMVNSLTEADIKTRGVPVLDLYLAQEAERMRKRTGAVEKVEEQCHPLNGLNFSQVIFALNQTLVQQESVRAGSLQGSYTTEDLIKHYNCGDLNSIIFNHDTSQVPNFNNVTLRPSEQITAQEIDSYFRQELIYKRNDRMGNRVKTLMEEHPDNSFFFAFGAGHFLGNNTVIDVLRSQGYEVEHTPAGQPISSRSKSSTDQTGRSPGQNLDESPYLEPFLHEFHDEEQQHPLQDNPLPNIPRHLPSLELMDTMDRKLKKKRRNKQKKHQRNRQFNDLWVRIEESTTVQSPPPPLVPIINGYVTVGPHHHDLERGLAHGHGRTNHHRWSSGCSASAPLSVIWLRLTVLVHTWTLVVTLV